MDINTIEIICHKMTGHGQGSPKLIFNGWEIPLNGATSMHFDVLPNALPTLRLEYEPPAEEGPALRDKEAGEPHGK